MLAYLLKLSKWYQQVSYHFLQLFLSFTNTFTIIWIYYENQALCVLKVVPPKWSDFVLAADIPDGEAYVFVFYSFDIETWNESRLQKIKHVSMACFKTWEFRGIEISSKTNSRVSCSLPIVGMVVTISPSFNLYRIVVLPAASKPTVKKNKEYV